MKKIILFVLLFALTLPFLTGCVTRIPDSQHTKEKLESLGYVVEIEYFDEMKVSDHTCGQVVALTAEKDGAFALQAYFFQNKEDTKQYFDVRRVSLYKNMESVKRYDYSIWRGNAAAIKDAFSE